MAQAGQAMNQTSCAGSPHPHVSAAVGCPDQTCHHKTTAGTVKQARATTWKPTARRPRPTWSWAHRRERTLPGVRPCGQRPVAVVSGAGCVDTSIPLVTAGERTAGPHPGGGVRSAFRIICAMPDDRRCVVVGAGLLGLATARALTRRGWRVRVLDAAGAPGHERSGSKGDARIFRLGYPDPHYVDMAVLARDGWRDLEAESGRALLHVTGQVTLGDEATLRAIAGALAAAGAPVEHDLGRCVGRALSRDRRHRDRARRTRLGRAGRRRVPACAVRGGRVRGAHRRAASRRCARPDSVAVTTADGRRWSGGHRRLLRRPRHARALLGHDTALAAAPSLPQVAYFAARRPHDGTPPVFIEWGDDMLYGLPVPGGGPNRGTYKVSQHTPGAVLDAFDPADPAPFAGPDPALLARLTGAVERLLPSLDPQPVATERCVYDNSADTDFVLDRVGRVVVGCGTSGHAFKFGPLLGALLADLAEGVPPRVDLARFGLHRRATPAPGPAPESR